MFDCVGYQQDSKIDFIKFHTGCDPLDWKGDTQQPVRYHKGDQRCRAYSLGAQIFQRFPEFLVAKLFSSLFFSSETILRPFIDS